MLSQAGRSVHTCRQRVDYRRSVIVPAPATPAPCGCRSYGVGAVQPFFIKRLVDQSSRRHQDRERMVVVAPQVWTCSRRSSRITRAPQPCTNPAPPLSILEPCCRWQVPADPPLFFPPSRRLRRDQWPSRAAGRRRGRARVLSQRHTSVAASGRPIGHPPTSRGYYLTEEGSALLGARSAICGRCPPRGGPSRPIITPERLVTARETSSSSPVVCCREALPATTCPVRVHISLEEGDGCHRRALSDN